jgi:hypothetical protein
MAQHIQCPTLVDLIPQPGQQGLTGLRAVVLG